MADQGLTLNSGSGGSDLAVDADGSSQMHQYVKLEFGPSGTQTNVEATVGLPVNLIDINGVAPSVNAGNVDAGTQRVVLASDQAVVSVDDNSGSLTVDNAALSVTGGGVEASALRVTIANDSTGVVSVDDNGGNLSVDWAGTNPPLDATPTDAEVNNGTRLEVEAFGFGFNGTTWDRARTVGALPATGTGVLAAGVVAELDDAAPTQLTEGQCGSIRATSYRALHANLRASDGTEVPTGGGVEADALRVTVASDSTGVLTVDGTVTETNSAAILADTANMDTNLGTLAGAVAAGQMQVDIVADGAGLALDATLSSVIGTDGSTGPASAVSIGGTDGSGNLQELLTDTDGHLQVDVLSGGGGGTQYDEDTTHNSGDTGTMALAVQKTADAALAGDGDYAVLQVDQNGYLKVNVKAGSGSGVSHTDDAAFTVGTDDIVPAGGIYRSVKDPVDDNDAGALGMTINRALFVAVETETGDTCMDDTNDALRVNVVAGSGSGVTHTDEATFTVASDDFVPGGGTYIAAGDTITTGTAAALRMSANRCQLGVIFDAAGNERGANVDANNNLTVAQRPAPLAWLRTLAHWRRQQQPLSTSVISPLTRSGSPRNLEGTLTP
jgi:hypothetical protein